MIRIRHNAGFFSCCSVKLAKIVEFINSNKKLPERVDSSHQFKWYKNNMKCDITFDYFEHYENKPDVDVVDSITYKDNHQFKAYANLDYNGLIPLVKKYFTPSTEINEIITNIEQKYDLVYENICVLFYRGNDKTTETKKCKYDEYLSYVDTLMKKNEKLVLLLQSDETEFIEFMTEKFPDNSFYFRDEIRHMKKCNSTVDIKMRSTNYEFSKKYLAITVIMSKCKYVICGTGNCDMWIMFYRGNNENVIQNRNRKWHNWAF